MDGQTLVCPAEGLFSIITAHRLPSLLPSPWNDAPRHHHPPRRRPGSCVSSACSPGRSGCASSSAAGAASPPWCWPCPAKPLAARWHKEGAGSDSAVTWNSVTFGKNKTTPQNLSVRQADGSSSSQGREPWQRGRPQLQVAHLRMILLSLGSAMWERKRKNSEQSGFSMDILL